MRTCPEFMAQIDSGGGRAAGEIEDLSTHLAACSSCAEYKADADKTQKLLNELGKRLTAVDPLDGAFDRLSSRIKASRRQMSWALALVAAIITAPFAMMLRGGLPAVVWGSLIASAAGAGLSVWRMGREQRGLMLIEQRAQGFYESWRRDLEHRIRITWVGAVFLGACSIGFLILTTQQSFPREQQFVLLGAAFLLALGTFHGLFVEVRDLNSELELLRNADHG